MGLSCTSPYKDRHPYMDRNEKTVPSMMKFPTEQNQIFLKNLATYKLRRWQQPYCEPLVTTTMTLRYEQFISDDIYDDEGETFSSTSSTEGKTNKAAKLPGTICPVQTRSQK